MSPRLRERDLAQASSQDLIEEVIDSVAPSDQCRTARWAFSFKKAIHEKEGDRDLMQKGNYNLTIITLMIKCYI